MQLKHTPLKYIYVCTCCWGCWSTHTCAVLHVFGKGPAADSHTFSSRPPYAGHWKLKYRHSTAIITRSISSSHKMPACALYFSFPDTFSEENSPECPAQACPRLLLPSYLPTVVNKCNVCQGCDSHPLEGNRSMSHLTKDKPDIRLSSPSFYCAQAWPAADLCGGSSLKATLKILH